MKRRTYNILMAVFTVLMAFIAIANIAMKKDWTCSLASLTWLIACVLSWINNNKSEKIYEAAQYFLEHKEETEENYECEN